MIGTKPNYSTLIEDYKSFLEYLEFKRLSDKDSTLNYWGNFPSDHTHLKILYNKVVPKTRFLDLGCGTGQILRVAKALGAYCHGVEFEPNFFPYLTEYDCECCDIRELPDTFYSQFDFIYIYRPLKENYKEYVYHVGSNMKKGALLYTPYDNYVPSNFRSLDFMYLYKKDIYL